MHFGTKPFDEGEGEEFPVMEKLNRRMSKILDKNAAAAAEGATDGPAAE